jgi:hypothetical protein
MQHRFSFLTPLGNFYSRSAYYHYMPFICHATYYASPLRFSSSQARYFLSVFQAHLIRLTTCECPGRESINQSCRKAIRSDIISVFPQSSTPALLVRIVSPTPRTRLRLFFLISYMPSCSHIKPSHVVLEFFSFASKSPLSHVKSRSLVVEPASLCLIHRPPRLTTLHTSKC